MLTLVITLKDAWREGVTSWTDGVLHEPTMITLRG
jgi:hypothetical protein